MSVSFVTKCFTLSNNEVPGWEVMTPLSANEFHSRMRAQVRLGIIICLLVAVISASRSRFWCFDALE